MMIYKRKISLVIFSATGELRVNEDTTSVESIRIL
jgi:hypothetical protein